MRLRFVCLQCTPNIFDTQCWNILLVRTLAPALRAWAFVYNFTVRCIMLTHICTCRTHINTHINTHIRIYRYRADIISCVEHDVFVCAFANAAAGPFVNNCTATAERTTRIWRIYFCAGVGGDMCLVVADNREWLSLWYICRARSVFVWWVRCRWCGVRWCGGG